MMRAAPVPFRNVYINATGSFLPGAPVGNEEIDRYIEPLNAVSKRIKRRILAENGIMQRHYAIDERGDSLWSLAGMGAGAVRACLEQCGVALGEISLLCTGTSGGDVVLPGYANMLQGELRASPMTLSSHQGVCTAGMSALQHAAMAIERGGHDKALVVAAEFPSRLFKRSRFAPRDYHTDFDSHFLRWMLSDGAGAWLLGNAPGAGISLRVRWVHLKSFSGDYPLCMQIGFPEGGRDKSYLDYPSFADAERDGSFFLRQDIRLLPHLFDVGIHEYIQLVDSGVVRPREIDYFLCHYSSEKFAPVIETLLDKAGLTIPRECWYSNLTRRGNTGAASIFIMLSDFLRERSPRPGEKILCFVPESGRFTVGYALLEVVDTGAIATSVAVPPPLTASETADPRLARLLQELGVIWHDYRSRAWRTPLVSRILAGRFSCADYVSWMAQWIPQVREGSRWMRAAATNLAAPYEALREIIEKHAADEQLDYGILFDDYRAAGGTADSVDSLKRNAGGEALNAYLHACSAGRNPVGLLGAIYIIEGTGQRIVPALLPRLKQQLELAPKAFRFLEYHGENDINHLSRWLSAVQYVLRQSPDDSAARAIAATARKVSELYLMQMEEVL